jgi:hypothetical protein
MVYHVYIMSIPGGMIDKVLGKKRPFFRSDHPLSGHGVLILILGFTLV